MKLLTKLGSTFSSGLTIVAPIVFLVATYINTNKIYAVCMFLIAVLSIPSAVCAVRDVLKEEESK